MMHVSTSHPARRAEVLAACSAGVTVVLWASAFVSIRSAGAAYSPGAVPGRGGGRPGSPAEGRDGTAGWGPDSA